MFSSCITKMEDSDHKKTLAVLTFPLLFFLQFRITEFLQRRNKVIVPKKMIEIYC